MIDSPAGNDPKQPFANWTDILNLLCSAYDFAFYTLYRMYQKQEREPYDTGGSEWYAWATLSFAGGASIILLQNSLMLVGALPGYNSEMLADIPLFPQYFWPFPIVAVLNFRWFMSSGRWASLLRRYEKLPDSRARRLRWASEASMWILIGLSFTTFYYALGVG